MASFRGRGRKSTPARQYSKMDYTYDIDDARKNAEMSRGDPMESVRYNNRQAADQYSRYLDDLSSYDNRSLSYGQRSARYRYQESDLNRYRNESPARLSYFCDRWSETARRRGTGDLAVVIERVIAGKLDPRSLEAYGACRQYFACKKIRLSKHVAIEQLEDLLTWIRGRSKS